MAIRRRFFFKAALSRFLFFLHGSLAVLWIWMIQDADLKSFYFGSTLYLLPIEMFITLRCTKHGEWKWFSPALMLYLLSVIPSIGFLHVDIHQRRMKKMGDPGVNECEQMVKNTSAFPELDYNNKNMGWMEILRKSIVLEEWPQVLEQTTMFLVILGRWMLPKGNLTREQLSQLLLVYLGMAADILEFSSESLAQSVVACDLVKIGIVDGIWGMSLCQFTLVLTSVAGPKIRNFKNKKRKRGQEGAEGKTGDPVAGLVEQDIIVKRPSICGSEIWSLLIVLLLQDCPFLAMRLYLIIQIKVVDRAMLFFAGKNLLVFLLVTYRIIVLCGEHNGKKVSPVPLVGFPQQPQVDAMVVRKQRFSWSLDPLLSRVTYFTNRLRNHVQVLDQEIGRRRGVHVPSESDRPTTKPMTPFLVVMEGHSVEVTEIDTIKSFTPDTTETGIIDTARSLSSTVDDRTTMPCETDPDGVEDTRSPILKLHHDHQPVPSMVEVVNNFEEIISVSDDSIKENLQAVGKEMTLGLGNDDQMKPADLNDETNEPPIDSSLIKQ